MLNVLVIDDERPTLSMFKLFLAAYGYNVLTAEDGETGLELFRSVKPEIVFTDLKMPGMDGLEVLRQIQQSPINSQVIVITGHGDMDKAVLSLDLDAADFINKPVEREALDAALLRAEQRMSHADNNIMTVFQTSKNNELIIDISGKISGTSRNDFARLLKEELVQKVKRIIIRFDENFSINKDGISALIELLNALRCSGKDIALSGLSFNFKKIFQMVGIHRSAEII